ncbi:hypothetical protein [Nocardiopsis kunsanensis]|uniref:hypothetical protein n=1 Tax=Nocardiopsis kunsanensis TaxID=141693 RepID=UPI000349E378|nr:hypothetical protein [Nocardiopsis kunsanensis]
MGRQVARLDTVREPLARAARALRAEFGADYLLMADELTDLWETPGVVTVLPSGTALYQIAYAAHLVMGNIEEMQEAARNPDVARVLAVHLRRPVQAG